VSKPGTIGLDQSYSSLILDKFGRLPEVLPAVSIENKKSRLDRIRRSVAQQFVSEIVLSSKLTGEFRSVTPVFINIRSNVDIHLRECMSAILSAASTYGGEVNGLYCSDPDHSTVLVLFGAPLSWEHNTSRAMNFALKLHRELDNSIRMGISEGTVYAGITGNSSRCTYTVYGDTVNTAARLVRKAKYGETLVTDDAMRSTEKEYDFTDIRSWLPRGKIDELSIGKLGTAKNAECGITFQGEMLGRSSEMNTLVNRIKRIKNGKFAGAAVVYGEAGIGKSRLLIETSRRFSSTSRTYVLKCDDILKKSFNPFVYFLKVFFHQNDSVNRAQNRRIYMDGMKLLVDNLRKSVSSEAVSILIMELERASSIIGSMLGHHWEDSVYSKLSPANIFDNTALALKTLIKAVSLIKPAIFIIEDLQWMDEDSKRMISILTRNVEECPFFILFSSRYDDDGSKPAVPVDMDTDLDSIDLRGIDSKSSMRLITDRLGAKPVKQLAEFIMRSSSGNPFYIEQFCYFMKESGLISDEFGSYNLSSGKYEIPSGIKSILVARMDRLPQDVRKYLQTASILGQEFSIDTLNLISNKEENQKLLDEGQRLRLWSPQSGSVFAFNHALYRDTAYGMVLGKNLHNLHSKAADVLININRDNPELVAGEVALHLKESLQISRAIDWGWRALCHTENNYRNNDGLEWSDRLRDWIMSQSSPGNRNELLLDVLLKKDSILHTMGNRTEQRNNIDFMTEICQQESWAHRSAEVFKAKGALECITGNIEVAFSLFRQGLNILEKASNTAISGKLYGNVANLYSMQGKTDEAREYYIRALEIHRDLGNVKQEGVTLGNLAILLRRNGDESEARQCYERALDLHRKSGNRIGEGRILCGLGHLEEEPQDALVYYSEALKINREIGDRRNEAIILSNLGRLETMQEQYTDAADYLDQALNIQEEIANSTGEADTHCLFGEMYYFMQKWKESIEHFDRAISISRKTGNNRQECIYQGFLGLTHFERGSIKAAVDSYRRTYQLIIDRKFPSSIDDSLMMLRDKLLLEGIEESEIPFPPHW